MMASSLCHALGHRLPFPIPGLAPLSSQRLFTTTLCLRAKALPPRPKPPPDSEIEESYLKGSGPGGQKINKTNSAVQLKHLPTGIVVKSQATRSRSQNRKLAREILAQKVDDALNGDTSRSAIVGEVKRKKAASAAKKSRRKYRKLDEQSENEGSGGDNGAVAKAAEPPEETSEHKLSTGGQEETAEGREAIHSKVKPDQIGAHVSKERS